METESEVWRAAYPETLGETLGPRFDLLSDLVLVQFEKRDKTSTNHKFAAERKQVVQKPLSLPIHLRLWDHIEVLYGLGPHRTLTSQGMHIPGKKPLPSKFSACHKLSQKKVEKQV